MLFAAMHRMESRQGCAGMSMLVLAQSTESGYGLADRRYLSKCGNFAVGVGVFWTLLRHRSSSSLSKANLFGSACTYSARHVVHLRSGHLYYCSVSSSKVNVRVIRHDGTGIATASTTIPWPSPREMMCATGKDENVADFCFCSLRVCCCS